MKKELTQTDIKINKPTPIAYGTKVTSFTRKIDTKKAIDILLAGKYVQIEGVYSNGLMLLSALQSFLRKKHPNQAFREQRAYRLEYKTLSNLILIRVKEHKLLV